MFFTTIISDSVKTISTFISISGAIGKTKAALLLMIHLILHTVELCYNPLGYKYPGGP